MSNDPFFQKRQSAPPPPQSLFQPGVSLYQHVRPGATWAGFLVFDEHAPDTLSFGEAWTNYPNSVLDGRQGGCYLFCGRQPDDQFLQRLVQLLQGLQWDGSNPFGPPYRWVCWFDDPNPAGGTLAGPMLPFSNSVENVDVAAVMQQTMVQLRNLVLRIEAGVDMALDELHGAIRLQAADGAPIQLFNQANALGVVKDIAGPLRVVMDDDAATGGLRFDLRLAGDEQGFQSDWLAFQVGLKYFFRSADDVVNSQRFPVLGPPKRAGDVTFQVSLDPLHALDNDRSRFTFGEGADHAPPSTFPSYFRTAGGQVVDLTPIAGQAGFVLAADITTLPPPELPVGDQPAQTQPDAPPPDAYYLAPYGLFAVSIDGGSGTRSDGSEQLLCGLSGTETIRLRATQEQLAGDYLRFDPGRPAYAPVFPIPPEQQVVDTQALLTGDFRTSWVGFQPGDHRPVSSAGADSSLCYLSQPSDAPLFRAGDSTKLLGLYQPITAALDDRPALSFPLVPYMGVVLAASALSPDAIIDYELHIVAPFRKYTIEQEQLQRDYTILDAVKRGALVPATSAIVAATTRAGVYVEIDSTTQMWTTVLLAQNLVAPGSSDSRALRFNDLHAVLKAAFQTNQQFVVISIDHEAPAGSGDHIFDRFEDEISIEGWPFILNVGKDIAFGNYRNVLIFKSCTGSVLERVANPKLWTRAADFNATEASGLTNLATWLKTYIQQGIDNYATSGDDNFQNFSTIVQDPNWNGMLALNVDIDTSPQSFPSQLQGLLVGIDLSRFRAHHIGVNTNTVTLDAQKQLTMAPASSLFGLINYVDVDFAPYGGNLDDYRLNAGVDTAVPYDFKVLSLRVLFENAKIKAFHSFVQLTINELFGDSVHSSSYDNLLILAGSCEHHNGQPAYSFNRTGENRLPVDNPLLAGVEVLKASFSTILPHGGQTDSAAQIHARFSLWGYLNFAALAGFDLFSFGSLPPADGAVPPAPVLNAGAGLAFANLGINMQFDATNPAVKAFEFDPAHLAFDVVRSTPRPDSLYAHFPIKLTGLTFGTAQALPASQGYLAVHTPDLPGSGRVAGDWYGLVFDLNMGSLGALAGNAGFQGTLLAVWQVGTGNVAVAIKLPGISAESKLLTIQGILKISIADIKLVAGQKQDGAGSPAYMLMLNQIALKFLGVSLPPNADIDFYLFGNPNDRARPGSLGWYAAYQKKS